MLSTNKWDLPTAKNVGYASKIAKPSSLMGLPHPISLPPASATQKSGAAQPPCQSPPIPESASTDACITPHSFTHIEPYFPWKTPSNSSDMSQQFLYSAAFVSSGRLCEVLWQKNASPSSWRSSSFFRKMSRMLYSNRNKNH